MLYETNGFRALESGMGAAWLQQKIANQNLANLETPGYKSKALVFKDTLANSIAKNPNSPSNFEAEIITKDDTEVRPDGNNVNSDTESMVLFKAYAQWNALMQKANSEINTFRYVLTNGPK